MKNDNTKKINHNQKPRILKFLRIFHRPPSIKQDPRANGLSLLPLALRPGLGKSRSSTSLAHRLLAPSVFSFAFFFLPSVFSLFIFLGFGATNASAASIKLSIPSSALSLDITPGSGAVFKKSSPETITVSTDSLHGYTFSIQSKTGSDLLNGSNKISSISSPLSESDYESSSDSNTWAYLPSKLSGSPNTNFLAAPTLEPTTLDTTDSSSEGTDYSLSLAAKVDNNTPSGSYANTFVLSATSNEPPYEIMQNWEGCDALEEHQTVKLLDTRDNNIYTVAKLKDGKCWMSENLRLGDEKLTDRTLTPDNTNITSNYTLPESSTSGFSDDNAENIYVGAPWNDYTSGYYTWHAATAGTGKAATSQGQKATGSICPKGWRLPTGDPGGEFEVMANKYGSSSNQSEWSSAMQADPAKFVLSGRYLNSVFYEGGSYGTYWSSIASSSTNAYHLRMDASSLPPAYTGGRHYGYAIRCISTSNDLTMQNVAKWADTVQDGETKTAVDIRDGNEYTVARLKDGRLWMTQNLRLGDSKLTNRTLTPNDTNITENYTLPASSTSGFTTRNYTTAWVYVGAPWNNYTSGYYSWCAATAGTCSSATEKSQNAPSSICPKGWRLPTDSEFIIMSNQYGSSSSQTGWTSAMQADPAKFVLSGYYLDSSFSGGGSGGHYWSSTASSYATDPNALRLWSTSVSMTATDDSYRGDSIRCVTTIGDPTNIGTLQTVDQWGDSVEEGETVKATDIRDNKEYTVARLKDGKLWMTKNLEIANKTLTPEDSDVISNFTLPSSSESGIKEGKNDVSKVFIHNSAYGGFYTWFAATAGEGTNSKISGDTSHSICPKGWRLPTSSEYTTLINAYGGDNQNGSVAIQLAPVNFILTGFYATDTLRGPSISAYYWSSSTNSNARPDVPAENNYPDCLYLNSTRAYIGNGITKSCGAPVRCVAR